MKRRIAVATDAPAVAITTWPMSAPPEGGCEAADAAGAPTRAAKSAVASACVTRFDRDASGMVQFPPWLTDRSVSTRAAAKWNVSFRTVPTRPRRHFSHGSSAMEEQWRADTVLARVRA